jgi:hypothetical protein
LHENECSVHNGHGSKHLFCFKTVEQLVFVGVESHLEPKVKYNDDKDKHYFVEWIVLWDEDSCKKDFNLPCDVYNLPEVDFGFESLIQNEVLLLCLRIFK